MKLSSLHHALTKQSSFLTQPPVEVVLAVGLVVIFSVDAREMLLVVTVVTVVACEVLLGCWVVAEVVLNAPFGLHL